MSGPLHAYPTGPYPTTRALMNLIMAVLHDKGQPMRVSAIHAEITRQSPLTTKSKVSVAIGWLEREHQLERVGKAPRTHFRPINERLVAHAEEGLLQIFRREPETLFDLGRLRMLLGADTVYFDAGLDKLVLRGLVKRHGWRSYASTEGFLP